MKKQQAIVSRVVMFSVPNIYEFWRLFQIMSVTNGPMSLRFKIRC